MTTLYFEASDEDDLRKAAFTAYSIYKELERILYEEKSNLSVSQAAELTHNMYQIAYTLPESKHT